MDLLFVCVPLNRFLLGYTTHYKFFYSLILCGDQIWALLIFQAHLLSVFDNVHTVSFDEKAYDHIIALNSQEGEVVDLEKHVVATVCIYTYIYIYMYACFN